MSRLDILLENLSPAWRTVTTDILFFRSRQTLLDTPASRSTHQAYPGGLVEHMVETADLAMAMASLAPYRDVNRDRLVSMALVHDIGKVDSYALTQPAPGTLNPAYEYTSSDRLLHHIGAGLLLLGQCSATNSAKWEQLSMTAEIPLLAHAIVSHHGHVDWKAIRSPQTLEAAMIHFADYTSAGLGRMATGPLFPHK